MGVLAVKSRRSSAGVSQSLVADRSRGGRPASPRPDVGAPSGTPSAQPWAPPPLPLAWPRAVNGGQGTLGSYTDHPKTNCLPAKEDELQGGGVLHRPLPSL